MAPRNGRPRAPARGSDGRRPPGAVSLERALSKLGAGSRSDARCWIEEGRVTVDHRMTRDPRAWVLLERQGIELNGRRVVPTPFVYLALHKPSGFVTTRRDERGRKTVYDLLPAGLPPLSAVGRLDKDTSGLLLLTNDTAWANSASDPNSRVVKRYRVSVDKPLTEGARRALESELVLGDGTVLRPAKVLAAEPGGRRFEMAIHEGKNRQIRRALWTLGYTVLALERTSIGAIGLDGLHPGEMRSLTPQEVRSLPARQPRRLGSFDKRS